MMRRLLWIALAAGCGSGQPAPAPIQRNISLHSVTGCPAVEKAVHDAAVTEMRAQLESAIYWRTRWGPGVISAGGADGTPAAAGGPASYTTTNVQVAGVDEADIVKTDGTRIFALSGDRIHAVSSWPPAALAATGSVRVEGWPTGFYLEGQRLAAISAVPPARDPNAGIGVCPISAGFLCGVFGPLTAKLTLIDATNLAVTEEAWLPGYPSHTRRIGSKVHLVTSDPARWPRDLKWWPEGDVWNDEKRFTAAVRALEESNEKVIRATPLSDWIPPSERRLESGAVVQTPYDCTQFRVGNAPVRLGFVTVATFDLDAPSAPPSRTTILGQAGVIYASKDSLVLATPHYWWWDFDGNRDWTYVHRFDLSGDAPRYVASGGFEGLPINSFSLDMQDGYLRAAVNTTAFKAGTQRLTRVVSSFVRVLDAGLKEVGSVELSPGEWVTGSRFLGDRGFVVTFRSIDPLFALDLRDPANPRRAGVLELPGFSTYLQALDDTHLLAIGIDVPPDAANWHDRSIQLSVFDVGDLSAPKRTVQHRIGSAWAWSEALWDHHAFNWFPEKQLLAVPFWDWDPSATGSAIWSSFASDLRVFEVHPDAITSRGALSMKDMYVTAGNGDWTWSWSPVIRRSVMAADGEGNAFVYAISDAGVRVAALGSLGTPLATALFGRIAADKATGY